MNRSRQLGVGLALLSYPVLAYAHSPYPGIRGFYVGALHPLTEPAHFLVVLAISLLLGTQVTEARFSCLKTLFFSTAAGLLLAFAIAVLIPTAILILLLLAGLGLLLVLPRNLPDWAYRSLAGASGFLLAMESIPEPGPFLDVMITSFGSLIGIHYLIMYGSRGVALLMKKWQSRASEIAVRVLGSWFTAIACLMLAFTLAGLI